MNTNSRTEIYPDSHSNKLLIVYFILVIPINWLIQFTLPPPWPYWLDKSFFIALYILIALIIIAKSDSLDESNIDKGSLVIFLIFGSILRLNNVRTIKFDWSATVIFCFIAIFLIYRLSKKVVILSTPQRLFRWLFLGLLVGGARLWLVLFFGYTSELFQGAYSVVIYNFLLNFWYQLSNSAISEEFVYRGLLWGAMRRFGLENRIILLIQAILFTFGHLDILRNQHIPSIIILFLFSVFVGIFAWKSRSLIPSLIAHALTNTITALFIMYS